MAAQLYGLVLTGGRSRRMREDKAALQYAGETQLARAMALLKSRVIRAFVSARPDQQHDAQRGSYDSIIDLQPDLGPLGGIQAALQRFPDNAWLILACDLPFLDEATLDHLIQRRDTTRMATAYRSSHDGLPEPLCAIFEPQSRAAVDRWLEQDQRCPRALLGQSDVLLLDPINPRALDNVNTREQYAAAAAQLRPRQLTVRYFALLREQAGRSQEQLHTQAHTPLELYRELRHRRGLALSPDALRVAINDEFADWQAALSEGDTVAFLPPVAGG